MSPFVLIIAIVPRGKGQDLADAAVSAGAGGGTIITGRGTASSRILNVLGIGDTARDIVYSITDSKIADSVIKAMCTNAENRKYKHGILFTVDVLYKLQAGIFEAGERTMKSAEKQLISVIVNQGYADDVMEAARNAGASGGTIVNARGTAKEGDAKFFGLTIVPEKEMLLLLVDNDKAERVFTAVKNLPCLGNKGSGIVFSSPVENFTNLGNSAQ